MALSMRKSISIDLRLTLFPSFTLALFEEREHNLWAKIVGYDKGSIIKLENGVIEYNCSDKVIDYWTGTWFKPAEYLNRVVDEYRALVERILEAYSRVSLSIDPFDKDLLIVPITLSRRTDYERNVLRWCLDIWRRAEDLEDILNINLNTISSSYQMKQLKTVVREFLEKAYPHLDEDPEILRTTLLSCRWIGPKVADAYLLFTGMDVSSSPIDIHLKRMNYRIFRISYKYEPTKSICIKYWCSECPRNRACIRWLFTSSFRELAGWLQTISYLHDRLYCSRGLCLKCPLKDLCRESGRAVRSDSISRKSKKSSCEGGKEEILQAM